MTDLLDLLDSITAAAPVPRHGRRGRRGPAPVLLPPDDADREPTPFELEAQARQAAKVQPPVIETWRCPQPFCRRWVQPSRARITGHCNHCDSPRPTAS